MASLTLSLFIGEDNRIYLIGTWEEPDEVTHVKQSECSTNASHRHVFPSV